MADPYADVDPAVMAEMSARFRAMPLHALLQLEILPFDDATPDRAVVTMPATPDTHGTGGEVHGGAIATLCDVACASAASRSSSWDPSRNALVTADIHVRYLGRVRGTVLRCEASVVKSGRTLVVVEGRVLDDLDNLVALATFSSTIVTFRTATAT